MKKQADNKDDAHRICSMKMTLAEIAAGKKVIV
jgi:hypothetical protein